MKKKIYDKNPHVAKFGLIVLEACVKNCGAPMHKEVATKEMMETFRELAKTSPEPVKEQILAMIQTWSTAFRKEPKYKVVQDTFNLMRMEGYKFPPISESSDALFTAETAPEWAEGDVCHMCRVKFSTFQRQHHCRNCGQVFCQKCSSKASLIPHYGIEREVRVCDPCYYKINPSAGKTEEGSKKAESASSDSDLPPEYLNSPLSREQQVPTKKTAKEIQEEEEEELQLAMALSLSQEEAAKEHQLRPSIKSSPYSSATEPPYASHRQTSNLYSSADVETDSSSLDPELARYLNRSYWEERSERQTSRDRSSPSASAPVKREDLNNYSDQVDGGPSQVSEVSEAMIKNFQSNVEMLIERMQKVSGQGKHIAMDATVQSLFQTVSAMHPQILRLIEEQEEEKAKYEALQVKLGLVREARTSLEEMREQHREKVRQQELEQDMLRRMQIEQKLELMRQQKAEYLAYQQRLQAERQAVIEQQQQQQRLQYQRQMQQQQQPYAGVQYPAGDSSPYSSLNYVPNTQGYNPQNPPGAYSPAVPQGYQVPDAPPPSQYPSRPPTEGYMQTARTDYMPYRNDAPAPQTELPPQPTSLEYQPPSYASQVPQEQGPASLQPFNLGGPSPVPTAPAQVIAQAPPPQYAQVTSQQGSQPLYGQTGGQQPPAQAPPQNQFPGAPPPAPTGQPQFNQMQPPQGQPQYLQQAQYPNPTQAQLIPEGAPSQYSNPTQSQLMPEAMPPQYNQPSSQVPPAKPQSYQPPQTNGFPQMDSSRGSSQMFSSGPVQSQLNMPPPPGPPSFQQGTQGPPPPPTMQQGAPVHQGALMQQQVYEPQQQQQQQFAPQQGYQQNPAPGPPGQQQPPLQYTGSAPPPQQSAPVLELISFD